MIDLREAVVQAHRHSVAKSLEYREEFNHPGSVGQHDNWTADGLKDWLAKHDRELVEAVLAEFPDRMHPAFNEVEFIDLEYMKNAIRAKYLGGKVGGKE